jgi:hypothetical protein
MYRAKNREKEFTDDIDRLLAGKGIKADENIEEDYRLNIDFTGKIIECRRDPTPSYKEGLKRRLLYKLVENKKDEIKPTSFWDWLRNLFSQNTTWRLATFQITVAILTLMAIWGINLFFSNQEPVLTWPPNGSLLLEPFFFILGLVNSLFLILIFLIRKERLGILQKFGWVYLLLAIPAVYGMFLVVKEQQSMQYGIFLGIFLVYLLIEWLYDYVLKINFRENFKKNWKWLVPYLVLYYAMNYGFVVMPWKTSMVWGFIMLGLFIIQIIVNIMSHPKIDG